MHDIIGARAIHEELGVFKDLCYTLHVGWGIYFSIIARAEAVQAPLFVVLEIEFDISIGEYIRSRVCGRKLKLGGT